MRKYWGFVLIGLSACAASPARPSPPADAIVGSGHLAPELIQKVVRTGFNELRKCYDRALARDPRAQGKTVTRFIIGRDGTVSDPRTTLSGTLQQEIGPCLDAAFQQLTFDAPSGGTVTVNYPIVFSPGK